MTIAELYNWAVKNHAENLEIEVQYRDDGGWYYGTDDYIEPEITKSEHGNEDVVLL